MPNLAPRMTIGRLMALVAVSAGVCALYRMMARSAGAVVLMIPLVSVLALAPVRYAQPKRWVAVASWIIAAWPLSIVVSLHLAFAVASVAQGRSSGPRVASPVVVVLGYLVLASGVSSVIATLIGCYLPLIAPDRSGPGPRRWNPQVVPVLLMTPVWLAVLGILWWDPVGAVWWAED